MPKDGQDEVQALRRIIEITGLLNSTLNLDELLQLIMNSAADLLNAETSSLLLHDEDAGDLIIHVATGESGEQVAQQRVPAGQGIAGWVMEKGEPVVVENPKEDPRFFAGMDEATGFETRNILALPLNVRDRTVGVVEVINKREGGFSETDRELAGALANQAAIAIDNAQLYAKLADAVVTSRMSYRL
jgi:sigma-B regulation protein RsbU (phosphoserine phosphatase)